MYNDEYFSKTAARTHMRLYLIIGLMILTCVGVGVCCALRLKALNLIVAGVGYIAVFFLWNLKLYPWIKYNKFMKDLRSGQKRELEVEFVSMNNETRLYDGILVYDMTTRVGDREEDERTYVWDADRPLPQLKPGQKLRVRSFGTFVVDITEI